MDNVKEAFYIDNTAIQQQPQLQHTPKRQANAHNICIYAENGEERGGLGVKGGGGGRAHTGKYYTHSNVIINTCIVCQCKQRICSNIRTRTSVHVANRFSLAFFQSFSRAVS